MMAFRLLLAFVSIGQAQQPANQGKPDVRCGSYCLYVALKAFGSGPATFPELEQALGAPGLQGYSMLQLQRIAEKYGVQTLPVETSLENLRDRQGRFTCITLIDDTHFVMLYDANESQIAVIDPPKKYTINPDVFRSNWSRKALLISDKPLATEESIGKDRWLRGLLKWGAAASVIAILIGTFSFVRRKNRGREGLSAKLATITLLLSSSHGCQPSYPEVGRKPSVESVPDVNSWLVVEPEQVDLGTIVRQVGRQEMPFEVTVRNRGFRKLTIDGLETSCACTDARISSRSLEPGESSRISASVKIGDSTESNGARITIHSNDPVAPDRTITATWVVKNALTTSPSTLSFSTLSPGEAGPPRTLPILLEGLKLCDQCVLSLGLGSRALSGEMTLSSDRSPSHSEDEQALSSRKIGSLQVSVSGQTEERFYKDSASIAVSCQGGDLAKFTLPISWTVAAPILASPSRLSLGTSAPAARLRVKLVIQSRDGMLFCVTSVEGHPPERLANLVVPATRDTLHQLGFDLAAPQSSGPWRDFVVLKTDHPGCKELRIPVSGVVEKGDGQDGRD